MSDRDRAAAPGDGRVKGMGEMKFLLILGVVLIHSFHADEYSPAAMQAWGYTVAKFISVYLCSTCVPCFFILSGYLFFYRVERFTPKVYLGKLWSRVRTLAIPYLVWCTVCMGLLYVKNRWLGMSGCGVFDAGRVVSWSALLRGYWELEVGYPYAYAFWFIRNLMVFVALSPLARIIARNAWLMAGLLLWIGMTDSLLYGFVWFILGGWLASEKKDLGCEGGVVFRLMWPVVLVGATYVNMTRPDASTIVFIVMCLSMLQTVRGAATAVAGAERHLEWVRVCVGATFMIYAVHQCMCSKTIDFWRGLIGGSTSAEILGAYAMTFLTLTLSGVLGYLVVRRLSPRLLALLTGGR